METTENFIVERVEKRLTTRVRCSITGFEGDATAYVKHITGCTQILVHPGVDDKGAWRDPMWFDVDRLALLEPETRKSSLSLRELTRVGGDIEAPKR